MTSVPDRESIKSLTYVNPPNNRNASGNTDAIKGFRNPPTLIRPPSNRSGLNPFGPNPNRRPQNNNNLHSFGNPTSRRTLVTAGSSRHDDRNAKRPRLDSGTYKQENTRPFAVARRIYSSERPLLAPEPEIITVDDDDEEIAETSPIRPSSDELNLPQQESKYFVEREAQRRLEPSTQNIADDGPDTKWVNANYPSNASDPISQYSEADPQQPPVGIVRSNIENIERRNAIGARFPKKISPKRVDLTKLVGKKNNMKPKPKATKSSFDKTAESPKIDDPFIPPIRSISKQQKEKNFLPVQEAFVGDHFYPDTPSQKLQLCWFANHKLVLKVNDLEVWSLIMDDNNCKQAQHSKEAPTFIVDPKDPTEPLVAIKFNVRDREWDPKKYKDIQSGAAGFKSSEVKDGLIMWESVNRNREGSQSSAKIVNGPTKQDRTEMNVACVGEKRKNSERSHSSSSSVRIELPGEAGPSRLRPISKRSRKNSVEHSLEDPVRRSSRNIAPEKAPPVDQDEVILVYPQGYPGAVNVTNGDLARLEPGEFLNDTLIEFGLKLWLKELEETRPDLAKQIHIFSSFFYKKLNGKKDIGQAFETVRKWTSKFDIFEKKYIIVPINEHLHWYLAIIYEPEHILSPPAPIPTPKKQTRSSGKVPITDLEEEIAPPVKIPIGDAKEMEDDPNTFGETTENNITPSEAEVEKDLNTDFQSSCNIEDNDEVFLNESRSSSGLGYLTEEGKASHSPGISDFIEVVSSLSSHVKRDGMLPSTSDINCPTDEGNSKLARPPSSVLVKSEHSKRRRPSSRMSVDMVAADSTEETESPPPKPTIPEPEPTPASISAIAPSRFYSRIQNYKGKNKAKFDTNPAISLGGSSDVVEVHEAPPKTYIFILDSLGTRHPQASKKLAKYLEMEAADKKGVDKPSSAQAKSASVPYQPNFCDCGVYLLHFARIFMNDPTRYCKSILSQKGKSIPNKEKQDVWEDHRVADMREDVAKRIRQLSSMWKQERAIKEQRVDTNNKVVISDSDDEIDIVDNTLPKKKNEGKASRPRG